MLDKKGQESPGAIIPRGKGEERRLIVYISRGLPGHAKGTFKKRKRCFFQEKKRGAHLGGGKNAAQYSHNTLDTKELFNVG